MSIASSSVITIQEHIELQPQSKSEQLGGFRPENAKAQAEPAFGGKILGGNGDGSTVQFRGAAQTSDNASTSRISVSSSTASSTSSTADDEDDDEDDYPEGGVDAWRVVFGSFLGLIAVFGLVNSLGAVQAYVSVHQLSNKSESQISWIFSVFVFLTFFFSGQVGPIYDAYGPYHLCAAGTFLFVLGLMTISLCTQFYQFFLSFSICCGIGSALLITPEIAIISHWFNKKRGTAIGAATVGGSLGGVIFPIMLRQLYSSVGFPWAIRTLGFISLLLLVCSIFLMKPRMDRDQSTQNKPYRLTLESVFDYKALRDMRFTWLVIANFTAELGVINGLTFLTSYALAQGQSEQMSYALLAILNSLGMFGRIVPGIVADTLGRFNTLAATTAAAAITIFAIWLPFGHTTAGLIAFAVLHGFCNGGIYSLAPVCCGQICKTRDYGKRYGTMYCCASVTILLGVPLSGALISHNNYTKLVIFNGCLYVVTTIALVLSRHAAVGFRWCKW